MIVSLIAAAFICAHPTVTDGDTLRCGSTRVRLAGIDAPELHGCRGRIWVPGDGYVAKRKMAALVVGKPLRCVQTGTSYDRVVAKCRLPDGRDLSCAAIGAGVAVRWAKYDSTGHLRGCSTSSAVNAGRQLSPEAQPYL